MIKDQGEGEASHLPDISRPKGTERHKTSDMKQLISLQKQSLQTQQINRIKQGGFPFNSDWMHHEPAKLKEFLLSKGHDVQ